MGGIAREGKVRGDTARRADVRVGRSLSSSLLVLPAFFLHGRRSDGLLAAASAALPASEQIVAGVSVGLVRTRAPRR